MQITFTILTLLFIVVSIALVLIVLVQRPQGGGLTGAFGGGGGTDTAFGGRTGDALTVATITAFTIYLLIAIGLNITSNVMLKAPAEPAANTAGNTNAPNTANVPADGGAAPAEPNKPVLLSPEQAKELLGDKQTGAAPEQPAAAQPVGGAPSTTPPTEPTKLPPGVTPLAPGAPSPTPDPAPAPKSGGE